MPPKGKSASAKTRAATDARRAKVSAAKADRATQAARIKAWRSGAYPMSEWTDEEIRRGRVGSEEGEFYGRGPELSRKQHDQLRSERRRRAMRSFEELTPLAIGSVKQVMLQGWHDADRLRASGMILDRSLGKVPDRIVELTEDPYADMTDDVIEADRSGVKKAPAKKSTARRRKQ